MTKRFVGIQVGSISFLDEGVEKVLDIFQERAQVNALMLACHTFGKGTGGRQVEGHPLPDHGVQEYDRDFKGGCFAAIHPQYYTNSIIKDFKAPDTDSGGIDILEAILPSTKARQMQVYCWLLDGSPSWVANFPKLGEVDVYGRKTRTPCNNNPDFKSWILSVSEDYLKSYDVDGIMWGSERQGPLGYLIGGATDRSACCFCDYCKKIAIERGINVERAIIGYRQLSDFVSKAQKDERPSDGYFVAFWRLLLNYPEILAYEKLWTDSHHQIWRELYGLTKAINTNKKIGWHIWHVMSFSPFYRAEQDYEEICKYSDFIKPVLYNNCAGPRFASYLRSFHKTIFHDATPEETLPLMYKILNYNEGSLGQIPKIGFSADYVYRETKRAISGVKGSVPIYPGIDIDIPTETAQSQCTKEGVKAAVKAAFEAGAQGVILSRKYSEMKLDNLSGAGEALKEIEGRGSA